MWSCDDGAAGAALCLADLLFLEDGVAEDEDDDLCEEDSWR